MENEILFPNGLNCPIFLDLVKNSHRLLIENSPNDFARHLDALHDNFAQVKRDLTYTIFRDDIVARQTHGLHVPDDVHKDGLFDKSDRLAGIEMAFLYEY